MKNLLTTFDIAEYLNVTHRAVLKWIDAGKLNAYRTPGNHNRVKQSDFLNFVEKYNMPLEEAVKEKIIGKKRVLVVDDDPQMVHFIKRLLKNISDFEIAEAYDGFTAGQQFAAFKPDLMTLDINMPKINGLQVLRTIRADKKNKNVKIIVISSYTDDGEPKAALKMGADAFFDKPFKGEIFRAQVKKYLDIFEK